MSSVPLQPGIQKDIAHDPIHEPQAHHAISRDEASLLNILIHYPQVMKRLMKHNYRVLLSNPDILKIFETVHVLFQQEGVMDSAHILEGLEEESAREKFRESMLGPSIFQETEIEQALKEFKDRIQKILIAESKRRALKKGDIEELNRIPKYIKERWG